jgi:hypothetical protein
MTTKIERILGRAMKVSDLIAFLQENCDEDAPVLFVSDYGDHCHTQQALPLADVWMLGDNDDGEHLEESAYSNSGIAVETYDEDGDEEEDEKAANPHKACILHA